MANGVLVAQAVPARPHRTRSAAPTREWAVVRVEDVVATVLQRSPCHDPHAPCTQESCERITGHGKVRSTAKRAPVQVPVIDVSGLRARGPSREACARLIDSACRDVGFFAIVGHGVHEDLQRRLERGARDFFARASAEKMRISMERGGAAWRGYFPVGAELTSGIPDRKEGLYFGEELADDDERVVARTPLHGKNLFPDGDADFRDAVLSYMESMTSLGRTLLEGIALGLGLSPSAFADRLTARPLTLFRIFNYPAGGTTEDQWGVGEHTDYGLLTILAQDGAGGLQVRTGRAWVDVPALAGTLVCNIGDMLERLTRGRYRSTPHRVRNTSGRDRLSFPFFFDPGFDAVPAPLDLAAADGAEVTYDRRWDGESVHDLTVRTYGEYVMRKVGRVFPALRATIEPEAPCLRERGNPTWD